MIEVPKIIYVNFSEELKDRICVYAPNRWADKSGLAGWYEYSISDFMEDGVKKIVRLGKDRYHNEGDFVIRNGNNGFQAIRVKKIQGLEQSELLDVIAEIHYRRYDVLNYDFLDDLGDYRNNLVIV
tara:strand:- start:1509 stop:1886 length:378 start_codon:yes stop_codon:yes gene_type:complete